MAGKRTIRERRHRRADGAIDRKHGTVRTGSRWSHRVMQTSNALDLERGVFTQDDPHEIALSLKRSAEASRRRKSDPFRSAMSMLNFHINRAGKKLPADRRQALEQAKQELRAVFHRD